MRDREQEYDKKHSKSIVKAQGEKRRMKKKEQSMLGGGKEKESEDMSTQNQSQPIPLSSPATERKEGGIRVEEKDLWDVYQNRKKATERWYNFMISNFGVIPDEMVVSRSTYNLIFTYLFARGMIAAGNWLDLTFDVSYDLRFAADGVMFYDRCTGAEINYGGGSGDVIEFFEKDILKRRKR